MADGQIPYKFSGLKHENIQFTGDKRCFSHYRWGRPCRHYTCPRYECVKAKIKEEHKRLDKGIKCFLNQGHTFYYLTIYPSDASQGTETYTDIKTFRKKTNELFRKLKNAAKDAGVELPHARASGIKSYKAKTPNQDHEHGLASLSWLPDIEPAPTEKHPDRYHSVWLEEVARQLGLTVWIELAQDPYRVVGYMIKNLERLCAAAMREEIDIPPRFRRVAYSRDWPKLDYQIRDQARRQSNLLKKKAMTSSTRKDAYKSNRLTPSSITPVFVFTASHSPIDNHTSHQPPTSYPSQSMITDIPIPTHTYTDTHVDIDTNIINPKEITITSQPTTTSTTEILPIDNIIVDLDIQTRSKIHQSVINKYSQCMKVGEVFPAIDVFHDGTHYWVADGFHRVLAAKKIGMETILAHIHAGTQRDALFFALGANEDHGRQLSRADKRRKAIIVLNDPQWSQWSAHEISRQFGLDNSFISKLRKELSVDHPHIDQPKLMVRRKNQKPYLMDISNKRAPKPSAEKDQLPESQSEKLVYLQHLAPEPIKQRFQAGDLGVNQACKLTELIRTCCEEVRQVVLSFDVSDPNIIPLLADMAQQKNPLFKYIAATGFILPPGSDEPIHISEANKRDIQDALLQTRFYHRLAAP